MCVDAADIGRIVPCTLLAAPGRLVDRERSEGSADLSPEGCVATTPISETPIPADRKAAHRAVGDRRLLTFQDRAGACGPGKDWSDVFSTMSSGTP